MPTHRVEEWLRGYFAAEQVDIIVVGRPLQMDGSPSASMTHAGPFAERLKKHFPDKKIVWHDERFTSIMAERAIIDGGVGKMARRDKALVDKVSAAIILQSFLDSKDYEKI